MVPQASVKLAIMLYVVLGSRPVISLHRLVITVGSCAGGNNISATLDDSAPLQLVHIHSTVILVSVTAVAPTVRVHSGGPTVIVHTLADVKTFLLCHVIHTLSITLVSLNVC